MAALDDEDPADELDEREPGHDSDEDDLRAAIGYNAERPAPAIKAPAAVRLVRGDCADCPAVDVALHPRCGALVRNVCADCAGKSNRRHVEDTRHTIRDLKAAAASGDSHEERAAMKRLAALVGDHQAGETIAAIRAALEAPAKGGRR